MTQPFVHCHVHDEFSTLDGMAKIPQLVSRAKELGFTHLAETNHGNVDGAVRFTKECKKQGIIPIVGSELYITDNPAGRERAAERYHLLVLAKNENGFRSLCRGLTRAHREGFFYKPRLAWEWVLEMKDVVVTTACVSGMLSHPEHERLVRTFYDRFGKDFYLEASPFDLDKQHMVLDRAVRLMRKYPIKLLATNDVHYLHEGNEESHEVLLAVSQKSTWNDSKRWKFTVNGLYLRTADEMVQAFRQLKVSTQAAIRALECSQEIAEKCQPIKQLDVELPLPPELRGKDPSKALARLVREGMRWRGFEGRPEYEARARHELGQIIGLGFPVYFLIVWELIRWCRESDIMTGPGRGSVGGSLVAYCLGITEVDPLKYGLPFERFISAGRIDLPDVDMDFEDRYRDRIFQHLQEVYGEQSVARVQTFSEMRGRTALRDVARVFGVPLSEVGAAADLIVQRSGGDEREDFSIEDACNVFEECKRFRQKYPHVVQHAIQMEGLVRHPGVHAAGVVVANEPLDSGVRCAVLTARDQKSMVNWDKFDLEYRGLMKLDLLGLNTLTILHEVKRMVQERHGVEINWIDLDLEDKRVLKEFSAGNTAGVFQFGSYGLQRFCVELGIESFKYVVDASALHRPGALKSGLITDYCDRKNKQQEVVLVHPLYDEMTADTFGIVLYQEQIMYLLNRLAGIPWNEVDVIRKVVSKKEGIDKMRGAREAFVNGCLKLKTLGAEEADQIWEQILHFGAYGFNKAHAVEYSLLSYWTMWSKVYYPLEFSIACLNFGSDNKEETFVQETRRLELPLVLPDIERSLAEWSISPKEEVVAGLTTIKGISDRIAGAVMEARTKRGGTFGGWKNFLDSIDRRRCNIRALEVLMRSGALTPFGIEPNTQKETWLAAVQSREVPDVIPESSRLRLDRIATVLDFSPDSDPLRRYRTMIEAVQKWWGVKGISQINYDQQEKMYSPYVGVLQEVKFGYRENLSRHEKRASGTTAARGYADALGGVYSNFSDGEDFSMVVINTKVLSENIHMKEQVEGATNKPAIVWARPSDLNRRGQRMRKVVSTHWVVMLDDLMSGKFDLPPYFSFSLASKPPGNGVAQYRTMVEQCRSCPLGSLRSKSVPMTVGKLRVMVLAEAPGRKEDLMGVPLVGEAGQILWAAFKKYGVDRSWVWATNILKCRPEDNKFDPKAAVTCAPLWLEKEIKVVAPVVIMVLGANAASWVDPDDKRKVGERGSTMEWSDRFGCWLVHAPHPASLIYAEREGTARAKELTSHLHAACEKVRDAIKALHPSAADR